MRRIIRGFDRLLRRATGIFEFSDEAECLLRLQLTRMPRALRLADGVELSAGDPVLMLHLWNEHVPPLESSVADLAWASRARRLLIDSLRAVAQWLASDTGLGDVRAIGGVTALISPEGEGVGLRLMRRLGFDAIPYRGSFGRFGEFWENLWAWGLMWAFNRASLRHRSLLRLRRTEFWMSADEFVERYGHP